MSGILVPKYIALQLEEIAGGNDELLKKANEEYQRKVNEMVSDLFLNGTSDKQPTGFIKDDQNISTKGFFRDLKDIT